MTQAPDPEDILSMLAYRLRDIDYNTIQLTPRMSERCPPLPRMHAWDTDKPLSPALSLGLFGRLPPEIFNVVAGMLDVASATRLAAVSRCCNDLLLSHPHYRELITHAPEALIALREMGLLHVHAMATIHQSLRASGCSACREFGPLLFLPTCRRACWFCLCNAAEFRIMSLHHARENFGLPGELSELARHLDAFCIISSSGAHSPRIGPSATDMHAPCSVVAITTVRDYALATFGSPDLLQEAMEKTCASLQKRDSAQACRRLFPPTTAGSPAQALDPILRRQIAVGTYNMNAYIGRTSLAYVSLPPLGSRVDTDGEAGLWCRGCNWLDRHADAIKIPDEVISALRLVKGPSLVSILSGLQQRVRTRESLLEHALHCYGSHAVMPELADGTPPTWQYFDEQTIEAAAAVNQIDAA